MKKKKGKQEKTEPLIDDETPDIPVRDLSTIQDDDSIQDDEDTAAARSRPLIEEIKKGVTYTDLFDTYNASHLVEYCAKNGLKKTGKKPQVIKRILHFLDTGETDFGKKKLKRKSSSLKSSKSNLPKKIKTSDQPKNNKEMIDLRGAENGAGTEQKDEKQDKSTDQDHEKESEFQEETEKQEQEETPEFQEEREQEEEEEHE